MGIPVWDRLKGSPMKIIQASCMAALTLCLAGVALADDLQTVGDSDSLGFSAPRLARIISWFEAQSEKGDPFAYEIGVSEATIKAHVSAILQKLDVESRTQAVIAAAKISGGQWRPSA